MNQPTPFFFALTEQWFDQWYHVYDLDAYEILCKKQPAQEVWYVLFHVKPPLSCQHLGASAWLVDGLPEDAATGMSLDILWSVKSGPWRSEWCEGKTHQIRLKQEEVSERALNRFFAASQFEGAWKVIVTDEVGCPLNAESQWAQRLSHYSNTIFTREHGESGQERKPEQIATK